MTDGKSPSDKADTLPWWPNEPAIGLADDPKDCACSGVRLECFRTTVSLSHTKQVQLSKMQSQKAAEIPITSVACQLCIGSPQKIAFYATFVSVLAVAACYCRGTDARELTWGAELQCRQVAT